MKPREERKDERPWLETFFFRGRCFFLPLIALPAPALGVEEEEEKDKEKPKVFQLDEMIVKSSCNLPGRDDAVQMTVRTLESLGIPLVVLHGPNASGRPAVSTITQEIRILGDVFEKPEEAGRLTIYLEGQVGRIRARTAGIPEKEKPRILLFGPSPAARDRGTAGEVFWLGTMESFFIEERVNARNAFQSPGAFRLISAEQLLALDPDVIVLCTAAGYHPPRELYEAPYCKLLREMRAVRNRRVSTLPWTPWNCEKRLEYPIDVMVMQRRPIRNDSRTLTSPNGSWISTRMFTVWTERPPSGFAPASGWTGPWSCLRKNSGQERPERMLHGNMWNLLWISPRMNSLP